MNTPTAHRHPHRRLAQLILLTTASFSLLTPAGAQVVAPVPPVINYQGRVTDAAGQPIGGAGATNRKMIFRIWDAATGGTRLWTEEQTVTIAAGEFSVLLGSGINATGTAAGESRPSLEAVFNSITSTPGGTRYLEVMVDEGGGTIDGGDVPISPRQQLTTTAYSFRAKSADSIASGTDLTLQGSANYGLGWYGAGRPFGGTAIDGPVLYGTSGGALGSYNGTTQTPVLRWNAAGQVGIGSASLAGAAASTKLVLQGDDTGAPPLQLNIRGSTDTNKRLLIGYNTTSNYGSVQAYNGASATTSLLLNPVGGTVGIGMTSPTRTLDVNGSAAVTGQVFVGRVNDPHLLISNDFIRASHGANPYPLHLNPGGNVVFGVARNVGGSTGNVGIGVSTPEVRLHIYGDGTQCRMHNPLGGYWDWGVHSGTGDLELWQNGAFKGKFLAANGSYATTSDRRLKTKIKPLEGTLGRVMKLESTSYWFKSDPDAPMRSLGLIAQDVKTVFPEVVSGSEAEGEFLTMDYSGLVPVLIKAVQELKEALDSGAEGLRKENVKLSGLLEQSRAEKEALEKRLSALEAQDKAREARLVAIEKLLLSSDKPAARTASLKQGGGAE